MTEPSGTDTLAADETILVDDFVWRIFRRTPAWFWRHRGTLETAIGFPAPIAPGKPLTYRRAEIEAWLAVRLAMVETAARRGRNVLAPPFPGENGR